MGFLETSDFEVREGKRKRVVVGAKPTAKRSLRDSAWSFLDDKRLLESVLKVKSVRRRAFDEIAAAVPARSANQCYGRFTNWLQHFNVKPRYLKALRAAIRVGRQHWSPMNESEPTTMSGHRGDIQAADDRDKDNNESPKCSLAAATDRALDRDQREALNRIISIYCDLFNVNVGVIRKVFFVLLLKAFVNESTFAFATSDFGVVLQTDTGQPGGITFHRQLQVQ